MTTIIIGIALILLFAVSNAVMYQQGNKDRSALRKLVFYAVSGVEEGELINDHLLSLRKQAQKWMDENKNDLPHCSIETKMTGSIIELVIYQRLFEIKS